MAASAMWGSKHRVELHLHLDGSFRTGTLYELAKKKKSPLGELSLEDFEKQVTTTERSSLPKILQCFYNYLPLAQGNAEALKRFAYEVCEDKAKEGVAYMEVRYCPMLFTDGSLTPSQVVQAVEDGLIEGGQKFGLKARQILCCLRGKAEWSMPTFELCREFRGRSVVGIDMAGDEEEPLSEEDIQAYVEAEKLGIHRTCHTGESQGPDVVRDVIQKLKIERIGHGYTVIKDEPFYQQLRESDIHFEVCPMSSYYTCTGVPLGSEDFSTHPAVRFAKDNVNFSINSDDPCLFFTSLDKEYSVASQKMHLNELQVARTVFNAARSCFLPEPEKKELMDHLKRVFNFGSPLSD